VRFSCGTDPTSFPGQLGGRARSACVRPRLETPVLRILRSTTRVHQSRRYGGFHDRHALECFFHVADPDRRPRPPPVSRLPRAGGVS
jgi:hypothetical protein